MRLVYTGSATFEGQSYARISQGGFISDTEIQDQQLSNLFDLVSQYTKQRNKPAYKVIALHNDSTVTATAITIYVQDFSSDSDSTTEDDREAILSIGYTTPLVDDCGNLYVKSINIESSPSGISFVQADGQSNAISLPDLAPDGYLILYLKRTLDPIVLDDDQLKEISLGTLFQSTQEDFELIIDFSGGE